MPVATLRTVGGSVVMAIPKRLLEMVALQAGSQVNMDVQQNQLIVTAVQMKRDTLAELLAQCDAAAPISTEEREWLDAPPSGLEVDRASH